MKMKSILLSMLAFAALVSCNKEADEVIPNGVGQTLLIKLPSNVVSKAVSDPINPDGTTKTAIGDLTVYMLAGDNVVSSKVFTPDEVTAKYARIENVEATVNKVLLVANKGIIVLPATTATAIKTAATVTAATQNVGTGIDGVILMGEGIPSPTTDPSPDGHIYKEVSINLSAIVSRFEISAPKFKTKIGGNLISMDEVTTTVNSIYKTFTLKNVFVNNAKADLGASPTLYVAGASQWTSGYPTHYKTPENLAVDYSGVKCYSFNVFPSTVPHIIFEFNVEYTDAYKAANPTVEQTVHSRWITIGGFNEITSITGNKIYKVGLDTSVDGGGVIIVIDDEDFPTGGDPTDPDPEQKLFDLGVTAQVVAWTKENITPSVN